MASFYGRIVWTKRSMKAVGDSLGVGSLYLLRTGFPIFLCIEVSLGRLCRFYCIVGRRDGNSGRNDMEVKSNQEEDVTTLPNARMGLF